jgi:hypothetical protein
MQVGNASPAPHKVREKNKKKVHQSINRPLHGNIERGLVFASVTKDRKRRTFGDFDSFYRLIVYGTGTLFNELIAFDTEIEDVRALHE